MRNVKRRQTLITEFQTIFKLLATTYNCFIETTEQALARHLKAFSHVVLTSRVGFFTPENSSKEQSIP